MTSVEYVVKSRLDAAEARLKIAREALAATRALVSEGASDGFTNHDWMQRLFENQRELTAALKLMDHPDAG